MGLNFSCHAIIHADELEIGKKYLADPANQDCENSPMCSQNSRNHK